MSECKCNPLHRIKALNWLYYKCPNCGMKYFYVKDVETVDADIIEKEPKLKIERNKKNNLLEIRVNKNGDVTGGQVLVSVGRLRNFGKARFQKGCIDKDIKRGWWKDKLPHWVESFMDAWGMNDIIITYGQNGTTQWDTEELKDLIETIEIAKDVIDLDETTDKLLRAVMAS